MPTVPAALHLIEHRLHITTTPLLSPEDALSRQLLPFFDAVPPDVGSQCTLSVQISPPCGRGAKLREVGGWCGRPLSRSRSARVYLSIYLDHEANSCSLIVKLKKLGVIKGTRDVNRGKQPPDKRLYPRIKTVIICDTRRRPPKTWLKYSSFTTLQATSVFNDPVINAVSLVCSYSSTCVTEIFYQSIWRYTTSHNVLFCCDVIIHPILNLWVSRTLSLMCNARVALKTESSLEVLCEQLLKKALSTFGSKSISLLTVTHSLGEIHKTSTGAQPSKIEVSTILAVGKIPKSDEQTGVDDFRTSFRSSIEVLLGQNRITEFLPRSPHSKTRSPSRKLSFNPLSSNKSLKELHSPSKSLRRSILIFPLVSLTTLIDTVLALSLLYSIFRNLLRTFPLPSSTPTALNAANCKTNNNLTGTTLKPSTSALRNKFISSISTPNGQVCTSKTIKHVCKVDYLQRVTISKRRKKETKTHCTPSVNRTTSRVKRKPTPWLLIPFLLLTVATTITAGPRYSSRIVETQGGAIRGVILEPGSPHLEPVEAFRGVPYAAPPVGELRLRPPEAPLPWMGTRLADTFGAACPQRPPDVSNRTAALARMPRGRFLQLRRLVPMLRMQSEDCLFLNLYVPGSGNRGLEAPYAVLVFVHGESFEWNSGNPYDGSVLASFGHVIVVTFNFRLGILGFLRTRPGAGGTGAWGGEPELALMDAVACLRWVAANIAAFGGDPSRVTLLGHDTGAALVNLLLLSGAAAGLFQRAALLSGSALSPWAQQRRPEAVRAAVAAQLGCPPERDLAPCLRAQPLASLMAVRVAAPRFLPAFGPGAAPAPAPSGHAGLPGEAAAAAMERATGAFIASELLLGAASTESYLDLNEADVQYGLEEDQRDRVLRTYVRNAYEFHLSEIFSAVRNEYTDWSRPVQHPINLRDAALEALSDGHTVAPLLRVAHLHARRGARTYFFHFGHQTRSSDYPQRLGSVRGEALPYLLGLPLAPGPPLLPHNYSRQDAAVAEVALTFLTNFAKSGNPNEPRVRHPDYGPARPRGLTWDAYEPSKQLYLSLTQKPRMRSHYRGHKMALWLNLIPQLHQPGGDDVSMRHHNFRERAEHFYSGLVRAESFTRPPPPPAAAVGPGVGPGVAATECTPNATVAGAPWDEDVVGVDEGEEDAAAGADDEAGLLRRLATRHYYSYTAALGVTVGVGCLLLVLNMLVFAGVFYRRRRRGGERGGRGGRRGHGGGEERGQAAGAEAVPLAHCPASAHVIEVGGPPPCYNSTAKARPAEPPPPPARTSSNPSGTGGAGTCTGGPGSTATIKKRVQIQEISV